MRGQRGSVLVRLLTALVLIPIALALLWAPGLQAGFLAFVLALVGVAHFEYQKILSARGIAVEPVATPLVGLGLIAGAYPGLHQHLPLLFTAGLFIVVLAHLLRGRHSAAGLGAAVLGVVYLGWIPAHYIRLHGVPEVGPGLVTIAIAGVALGDTGGFGAGKLFGRHKMAPRLSPKKSWEGLAGGVALSVAGMAVVYALRHQAGWTGFPEWSLGRYALTGVLLAGAGAVGDLMESMLKRDAGVKDAGKIFPGHGGVLDRCDGLLFGGPVVFYLVGGTW